MEWTLHVICINDLLSLTLCLNLSMCDRAFTYILWTCESEISVRIESRIESGVAVYMFNADCHVGVV